MKIALFVEGPSDKETLTILAKRLAPKSSFVTRVLGRGDLLSAAKVAIFIREDIKKQHRDTTRILLCVDSECTPETELLKIVRPVQKELDALVAHPPSFYCSVTHATEAWLACDLLTLRRYIRSSKINDSRARAVAQACKPKLALAELFDQYDREFVNVRDNPRLASEVALEELIKNSKSFARFAELIQSPK